MITTTQYSIAYTSIGTVGVFAFPYLFLDDSHIVVVLTHLGVDSTLILNSDYTVIGAGSQAGGTVTLTTIPPSGDTVTIYRNVPITQLMNYIDNDSFPAESHESALDKITMILQQVAGGGGSTIPGVGIILSAPSGTATEKTIIVQTGSYFLVNAWLIDGSNTVPSLERTLVPPSGSPDRQWSVITDSTGKYTFTFSHPTGAIQSWKLCVEVFGQVVMSDTLTLGV